MTTKTVDPLLPSAHPPFTVDHALDQITDPEKLRGLVRAFRAAMIGQHEAGAHILQAPLVEYWGGGSLGCPDCVRAAEQLDDEMTCDQYKAWQIEYVKAMSLL